MFTPKERLLLLLMAAEGATGQRFEPIKGATWLQKEFFVALKNLAGEEAVRKSFEPHRMGMYSEELVQLLGGFVKDGLAKVDERSGRIELTESGRTFGRDLTESGKAGVEVVTSVKQMLNGLSYPELIVYVYSVYPSWDEASEVARHLRNTALRRSLASRLYDEGRITAERAALVAGVPLEQFLRRGAAMAMPRR